MADIKTELCLNMYNFIKNHIDELNCDVTDLCYENKAHMLKQIKTNWDDAVYCLREVCTCLLDDDYCSKLYVVNDNENIYRLKDSENKIRYFKVILPYDDVFTTTYTDVVEVVSKTKTIVVETWEPVLD